MKASMLWKSAALAAAIGQWPIQASADITALQAKELRMMAGAQMQQAAAMARGYMVGMVEGCAQAHSSLRKNADAALVALGMDGATVSSELGACLDKRRAPDESTCRSLIQQAKPPQNMDALAAFFESPSTKATKGMVESCDAKFKKDIQTAMAVEAAMFDMAGIVEGCAQSHPSLRPSAVAAYSELGMKADLSAVFGACLDKDHVPDESKCRNLIQHAKPPQSVEALSAFFDLPGAQSAKKIVAACN